MTSPQYSFWKFKALPSCPQSRGEFHYLEVRATLAVQNT